MIYWRHFLWLFWVTPLCLVVVTRKSNEKSNLHVISTPWQPFFLHDLHTKLYLIVSFLLLWLFWIGLFDSNHCEKSYCSHEKKRRKIYFACDFSTLTALFPSWFAYKTVSNAPCLYCIDKRRGKVLVQSRNFRIFPFLLRDLALTLKF